VASLTTRLADTKRGLSELVHGDLDVRASFTLSYQSLDSKAKAMLRRASLLETPEFPAWAGAALLDISMSEAEDICERLADAQLLEVRSPGARQPGTTGPEPAGTRYSLHDLVRAFAREHALASEPEAARRAALTRALGAWLALAERAHRGVYGGDFTILHGSATRWEESGRIAELAAGNDPVTWLDGERAAIAAAIRQSADMGLDELSWDLAWTAVTLYQIRGYPDDWVAAQRHAHAAACRSGNQRGQAAMVAAYASCMLYLGRFSEAQDRAEESLRLFTVLSGSLGCGVTLRKCDT
jgi:hypothetical protein